MIRLVVSVSRRCAEPRGAHPHAVLRTAAQQKRTHSAGLGISVRQQRSDAALQVQQKLLSPKSAAVPAQLAILVHDPMARNQDGNPVLTVRPADRTLRPPAAHGTSHLLVGAGLPIRNAKELLPDGSLESAARVNQRNRKRFPPMCEIARQLILERVEVL